MNYRGRKTWKFQVETNTPAFGHTGAAGHPEASIFVAIDTSGSMAGTKIRQVCNSLLEIISNSPNYVRFIIRTFNRDVRTLVSKKKKYLDVQRMKRGITEDVGHLTALYDAWGTTIEEIPFSASKLDLVHVLIFTDGEDNASTTHTLDSVIELTNENIVNNMHFTFIQAGEEGNKVGSSIERMCSKQHCSIINVEDSADGIRIAFGKARDHIKRQFGFQIHTDGRRNGTGRTQRWDSPKLGNISVNGSSAHARSGIDNVRQEPGNGIAGIGDGDSLVCSQPSRNGAFFPPYETSINLDRFTTLSEIRSNPAAVDSKSTSSIPPPINQSHQVWVGNIPLPVSLEEIDEYFAQWGKCTIESSGATAQSQWAVVNYGTHLPGAVNATKYGSANIFHGSKLIVNRM